ncbi:MAG: hypothetical protein P4L57_11715 [Rhizomicrobium sp.]|nr:hypothetical protein [Rhizomicrobium sp.]
MVAISTDMPQETRERLFFVTMAFVIAITILAGFGSWALRGFVVQPVPLLVHLHGLLFVSWVGIFISQTLLIQRNSVRLHRRVGWLALAVAGAMLVVGSTTAIESVVLQRVPPFFPPNIFLALSFMELVTFATLLTTAIAQRRRTQWHRRLMLGAMIAILGPAWGRMLPMTLLGPFGGFAVMGMQMLYVAPAMIFDWRQRGSIHPAYYWVLGALFAECIGTPLLGMSPPFVALAKVLAPH